MNLSKQQILFLREAQVSLQYTLNLLSHLLGIINFKLFTKLTNPATRLLSRARASRYQTQVLISTCINIVFSVIAKIRASDSYSWGFIFYEN